MPRLVTFSAQTDKVIKVKRDLRPVNVPRLQLLNVMDLDARTIHAALHAVLAQIASALHVFVAAVLPRLT